MAAPLTIKHHPSPNYGTRKNDLTPAFVVLHYTAMASTQAAIDWLCTPKSEVSAHYVISPDGAVTQLVAEEHRAWHAGAGQWCGLEDMNSRSIGIELSNTGAQPFPEPQMAALETLLAEMMSRWDIAPAGVIGHSDLAPGRKVDPGRHFDWRRLELQGLAARRGHDTGPRPASTEAFRAVARHAGYTADVDDATLLAAVRLRYRPWASGPLQPEDFTPLGHCASWT